MKEYGTFAATRSVAMPSGWVIPSAATAAFRLEPAIERLRIHGIRMRTLDAAVEMPVEQFVITGLTRAERVFQGRRAVSLTGAFAASTRRVDAGSIVIDAAQPLARLAFYLLEPESDDGFVAWNLIDEGLAVDVAYPIWRLGARAR